LEDAKPASPADVRLSELRHRNPTWTVGMLCFLREQGGYSDEGIARKLHFDSVEDMRAQLRRWVLPDWLVGGESQTNLTKDKVRKGSTPRWWSLSSATEPPPAGNATALFRERFEALLESVELLRHMEIDPYAWRDPLSVSWQPFRASRSSKSWHTPASTSCSSTWSTARSTPPPPTPWSSRQPARRRSRWSGSPGTCPGSPNRRSTWGRSASTSRP
jgi:hypothetical protein